MRPRDPRVRGVPNMRRSRGRRLTLSLLLVTLALAPALDLARDAGAASPADAPVKMLDLCTLSGLTPPPPRLAPVMAISWVSETGPTSPTAGPAQSLDHPPRPA